jgi:uncharacterized membrane protein
MATAQEELKSPNNRIVLILLIAGFAITFTGIAVIAAASVFSNGDTSYGITILIGPIPIIIGNGSQAPLLIALGIAFTILAITTFIIIRNRKNGSDSFSPL